MSTMGVSIEYSVFIVLTFQTMVFCPPEPAGGCLSKKVTYSLSPHHLLQRINQVGNSEKAGRNLLPQAASLPSHKKENHHHKRCFSLARNLLFCTLSPLMRFCFLFEFRDKTGNYRTVGVAEHSFQFKKEGILITPLDAHRNYSEYIINSFLKNPQ